MQLVLRFRHLLPTVVMEELDGIVATVRAFFGVEHKADGTHGHLHADSITVTGPIYAGVPPVDISVPGAGGAAPSLSAGERLLGRGEVSGPGPAEEITLGNLYMADTELWANTMNGLTGDVVAAPIGGAPSPATIQPNVVSYAKMQDVSAASRLLGRGSTSAGDPQEITLGPNLSMSGTTLNAASGATGIPIANLGPSYVTEARVYGTTPTRMAVGAAGVPVSRVMSAPQLMLSSNLDWTGTQWLADDTAQASGLLQIVGSDYYLYASPAGANPRAPTVIVSMLATGAITERGRTVPMGEWISIPYSAANFSATGGTWTVEAGDYIRCEYTLIGKTAILSFWFDDTTVSGTATELLMTLPAVLTCSAFPFTAMVGSSGTTMLSTLCVTMNSGTSVLRILATRLRAPFAAVTNGLDLMGQIVIPLA